MRAGPVARAARGGLTRRRVQTFVIGLVLLVSTGASVLALAIVVDSSAPFDHAFAAQRGADVVAIMDSARATDAQLAATRRLPEVTAAAWAVRPGDRLRHGQQPAGLHTRASQSLHHRREPPAADAGRPRVAGRPGR
jgi:putative ABC transport system permease protein